MIPLTVHYLELSGKVPSRFTIKRIEALKKKLPDHVFIEWNARELAREGLPPEVEKILESREPEKASSYICAHLLCRYGGVYMEPETVLFHDLSILSPVGLYCFREYREQYLKEDPSLLNPYGNALKDGPIAGSGISTALMASERNHPLLTRYMQLFCENDRSIRKDRAFRAQDLWATAMRGWGLRYLDELQVLYFGVLVYPSVYLPSDPSRIGPLSLGASLRGDPWETRGALKRSLDRRAALKAALEHEEELRQLEGEPPEMPLLPGDESEEQEEEQTPETFFAAMDGPEKEAENAPETAGDEDTEKQE